MVSYDRLWDVPQASQEIAQTIQTEGNALVDTGSPPSAQWETSRTTRQFLHTLRQIDYFAVLTENLKKFIYVDFFLPVAVLLALFLHRCRPSACALSKRSMVYRGMALVFVIYVSIFVISYGRFVYDWQVVRLFGIAPGEFGTPRQVAEQQTDAPGPLDTAQESELKRSWTREYKTYPYTGVYLIAEVGGNYLFLEKHQGYEVGRILSVDKREFPHMRFDLRKTKPLRQLISRQRSKVATAHTTITEYLATKGNERPQREEKEYEELPRAGGWVTPEGRSP